ncbi:HyaD/HybD family hydrogenase maturation endopeptidase [Candidatus Sulfurimonas marisnigri]|uniref:HyaD/HybD family hydrogenase maturation endopeptidase n=1 Tax=Candidatus Sulfurimonas marisnigri TaxID=2740405 RepID=A0A7S7LYX0_9BACT|nr:HyaD/HybD family hydrogenase maturation endopeptidase [Candidatus Sulfurimonas marisnigri]QOY53840.1 HyaD/HybD family hydrogenase maturation endopeptidase [Candidatus Sulfurimonas marisnigri]
MAKNIIIGIGNLLFCDDGVGIIAASYLKKNFDFNPELEILDGGTLGFGLIEYFLEYDNVFIIDTISIEDEAGEVYKIPSDELLGSTRYKNTAHEVEVVQMLEACELHDKIANVTIFGVVAEDIYNVKIGLSKALQKKFNLLIEAVIKSVEELGVKAIKKDNVLLQEVIKELK